MRRALLWIGLGLALAMPGAASTAPAPREVNLTADSTPGWIPSEVQEAAARKAVLDYLAAQDGGRYDQAYAMLDPLNRGEGQPAFAARVAAFNARAGKVLERRIVRITWTAGAAGLPKPGAYAAIDLVGRFANIDRHCGYVVVFQPQDGAPFTVMREEINFIDNATAEAMKPDEAARAWKTLSANCPNYPAS